MTPTRWQQVKPVLQQALDQPAAARGAFLDRACEGDTVLRAEVESLLAASDEAGEFLNQPALDQDLPPGTRLGPWRLAEPLGRGGMGAVYRAVRDDDQYQQEGAIKLVKRGMDTGEVLARFRYERQILAFLNHPSIARILDGGAAPDGRPYLVMELVEGVPITDYCARHALSVEERIELFRCVCAAVEYAHRNLIVHRDLKPGNILITPNGEPKLLDFGIAKILLPALPQLRTTAGYGERLLTPDYASPEQVRGQPVSTSTDVYSLGAVLYELLTGAPPHRIEALTPAAIERAVCDTEPVRPSAAAPAHAARLRGDLDTILLKALSKDVDRRYSSVEQFGEDLRRHLEGLPVRARPDTIAYRARKFVTRHRAGAAFAALLAFVFIGGAAATAWQAREARWERDRATRWFEGGRRLANAFLIEHDALASIPGGAGLREKLMTDALHYLDSLAAESAGMPGIQEELALAYEKMGDVEGRAGGPNLGDTAAAIKSYRKAIALREQLPADPQTRRDLARAYFRFAGVLRIAGDFRGGLEYDLKALDMREALSAQDPANAGGRAEVAMSLGALGDTYAALGQRAAAAQSYRRALFLLENLELSQQTNTESAGELQRVRQRLAALGL